MNKLLLVLVAFYSLTVSGQNIQDEINHEVWKPFIQAYNTFDVEGYMELHSKDVIRAPRDSKQIYGFNEYATRMEKSATQNKMHKGTRKIELRFTERIANGLFAYEVGIFKVESIDANGHSKFFYGKFHVVLRKEDNQWKIIVDSDSSENNTVDEVSFLAAQPIEY